MILAELTLTDCIGIGMLIMVVASQITLWVTMKSPQRRDISILQSYVNKSEFDAHVADNQREHRRIEDKADDVKETIGEAERRIKESGSADVLVVHERINELVEGVGKIKGKLKIE